MLKGYDDLKQYKKKLEHVNNIIRDIASKNPNITPITAKDYALFEDFFAKEEKHTYGNSWIYITQGTFGIGPENLGYKYYDGKNLCAIAIYPKIEQPDIIMMYWIRPMGENILPIIVELSEKIKREYNVCCYVKKLFPEQYEFLLQYGFKSAKEFPWHSSTHSEDDTYPELIFDREKTIMAIRNTSKSSRLGRVFRGVAQLKRNNKIILISDDFQYHAWRIVNTFFSRYNEFANKLNLSSPFDYYNMIFSDIPNKDLERKIILINRNPAGFYVLTKNNEHSYTLPYGCIMLRQKYKYLSDYWFIELFNNASTKYINLGGSEDIGIHDFKNKYKPDRKNIMYWVTNYL
ncbi:MAG: hypothetical protein PVG30_03750 [Gammaproteobacteria bacterium]